MGTSFARALTQRTQAGWGLSCNSWSTSILNMLKDRKMVVSVKDFGARGDGRTDDTEAFKLAAKSLAHIIKVPPGNYVVNDETVFDYRFRPARRR